MTGLQRNWIFPTGRTGKLVVGFTEDDRKALGRLKEQGEKNGIQGMKLAGRDFIRQKAPLIRGEFALWSPHHSDFKSL